MAENRRIDSVTNTFVDFISLVTSCRINWLHMYFFYGRYYYLYAVHAEIKINGSIFAFLE